MRLIYHYCSMDTFNIIMKNKTLRLCDITKSNDKLEKLWIYNNLEVAMENAFREMNLTMTPRDGDAEDTYLAITKSDLDEVVRLESLVVCFSKAADLLSQWRGYANDGCGFAIGFDQDLLQKYLQWDERFRIEPIEYETYEQIKTLESDIKDGFLNCVLRNRLSSEQPLPGKGMDFSGYQDLFFDEYEEISEDIVKQFEFSSCFMKNRAFIEEKEVRIVFASNFSLDLEEGYELDTKIKGTTKLSLGKIDYFVRGRKLVPFIDMNFSKAVKDGLIKKIIIGPKADVSEKELSTFLWHNGFDGVEIEKSRASYV